MTYNIFAGVGFGSIVFFLAYFLKRIIDINRWVSCIAIMIIAYTDYHEVGENYFRNMILSRTEMYCQFWINDFRRFIIKPDRYKILSNFYRVLNKKSNSCIWCSTTDEENFQFIERNDNLGVMLCLNCGACTPLGTEEECKKLLKGEIVYVVDVQEDI